MSDDPSVSDLESQVTVLQEALKSAIVMRRIAEQELAAARVAHTAAELDCHALREREKTAYDRGCDWNSAALVGLRSSRDDALSREHAERAAREQAEGKVLALREALADDVADGENVPGITDWLRDRKGLLADTQSVAASVVGRLKAPLLRTIEESRNLFTLVLGATYDVGMGDRTKEEALSECTKLAHDGMRVCAIPTDTTAGTET